jgi:hypothetical protein
LGHVLDAGGSPVGPLDRQLSENLQSGDEVEPVELSSTTTSSGQDEPLQDGLEPLELASTTTSSGQGVPSPESADKEQSNDAPTCAKISEAQYLLLCCVDSLLLYATHAIIQVSCGILTLHPYKFTSSDLYSSLQLILCILFALTITCCSGFKIKLTYVVLHANGRANALHFAR